MFTRRFARIRSLAGLATIATAFLGPDCAGIAQDASTASEATQQQTDGAALAEGTSATQAQARLQTAVDGLREKHHLPALWGGKFYADGRAIFACSGVRKWQSASPADIHDAVHIGSCTKAMTAVMIAQLCSNGSLSFESRLGEIFPDEEGLVDSAWGHVTVSELLQHRSGAPANADWQKLHAGHPQDPVAARRAMLQWLAERRRPQKPTFEYSNVGYALLGHIVETVEHQPWESLIATRLFEPLDIKSAGLGPLAETEENGQPLSAWGHAASVGLAGLVSGLLGRTAAPEYVPMQIDNAPPLGPAGRAHMNLSDWSRFVLLFASDKGYEKLGIRPAVWAQLMQAEGTGDYAAGWIRIEREWAGGQALFHNGSNTTWYCVAFVAPKKGYCLLAATNTYNSAARKACDRVAAAADGLGF